MSIHFLVFLRLFCSEQLLTDDEILTIVDPKDFADSLNDPSLEELSVRTPETYNIHTHTRHFYFLRSFDLLSLSKHLSSCSLSVFWTSSLSFLVYVTTGCIVSMICPRGRPFLCFFCLRTSPLLSLSVVSDCHPILLLLHALQEENSLFFLWHNAGKKERTSNAVFSSSSSFCLV